VNVFVGQYFSWAANGEAEGTSFLALISEAGWTQAVPRLLKAAALHNGLPPFGTMACDGNWTEFLSTLFE
jgi:hypothetical protein